MNNVFKRLLGGAALAGIGTLLYKKGRQDENARIADRLCDIHEGYEMGLKATSTNKEIKANISPNKKKVESK